MTVCRECEQSRGKLVNQREIPTDCSDCQAEKMWRNGRLDKKLAEKFCDCFGVGHDREKLQERINKRIKKYSPKEDKTEPEINKNGESVEREL